MFGRIVLAIAGGVALDGYGPAANVTGDGAIALAVDHWFARRR